VSGRAVDSVGGVLGWAEALGWAGPLGWANVLRWSGPLGWAGTLGRSLDPNVGLPFCRSVVVASLTSGAALFAPSRADWPSVGADLASARGRDSISLRVGESTSTTRDTSMAASPLDPANGADRPAPADGTASALVVVGRLPGISGPARGTVGDSRSTTRASASFWPVPSKMEADARLVDGPGNTVASVPFSA
jgi:hypothetical protein